MQDKTLNKLKAEKQLLFEKSIQPLMKKVFKQTGHIKLHVGCGKNYFDGWINIDNNSDNNIQSLDLIWDLRNSLPFPESSIDYIFNEHFLEHLSVEEGQTVLKDFLRILKPNGILRVAMPDLEMVIKNYMNENLFEDNASIFKKYGLEFIKTNAEYINIAFRSWGHKWLYDYEELDRRLKEAGFIHVVQEKIYQSSHKTLQSLETRAESVLVAEASKGVKTL